MLNFSMEQSDGHLVLAWEQRHYFGKCDLIYLSEKAYFLVSCSTIWSYVSFVFKMFIWFDFLLDPFCFCEEVNTFFEERRMWFFLFSVTLFIAFTKCNQWMVLVLSDDVPSMCFSSQPFAGWEDTFWQSPEP